MVPIMEDHTKFKLNDGGWIPSIAFGTGTTYFDRPDDVSKGLVTAVKNGYKLIDTAVMYGTEVGVGQGLSTLIENDICKREDLFITTKLAPRLLTFKEVIEMVDTCLKNLKLDYIDLMMIHFPGISPSLKSESFYSNDPAINAMGRMDMWDALQVCQSQGKIKHIGVSNFTRHHIEALIKDPRCKVIPAVNQIEFNPYLVDSDILQVCKDHGILVQSYGPIGSGSRQPANPDTSETNFNLLEDPVLLSIAQKHGCTVAQICIGYALRKNVAVVTKTEKEERMKENLKSCKIAERLENQDIAKMDMMNKDLRKFWDPYAVA